MKPELGPPLVPDFAGRPAHMSAIDFILWQRFRQRHGVPFARLFVDVAVGAGAPGGPGIEPPVLAAWTRITRQRIDVVGETPEAWTLIEIRGAAGPGAVGSLIVYRTLWVEDPPDQRPLRLWLVTDVFPEALVSSLREQGITLFLV